MKTISATYRVTTPLFLGGADNKRQVELRLPSLKGGLRFWWRALAWRRITDVTRLHAEESALFGSSDEQVGQSKVLMRLDPNTTIPEPISPPEQLKEGDQVVGPGARYLGYGVMEAFASGPKNKKEGQLTRPCLPGGFEFTVNFLLKPTLNSLQKEEILQSLKILGIVGGLGSKSRKGYGSLTLMSLAADGEEIWTKPIDAQQVADTIRSILAPNQISSGQSPEAISNELPEWTAFFPETRVVVLSAGSSDRTPLALLDRIGRELVRYRSWGRNGIVLGNMKSEKNFRPDHDLMKSPPRSRKNHPERIVFGLPHNYGRQRDQQVGPADPEMNRRASPLFIHIHQPSPSAVPVGVLTFFPSRFLPQGRDVIDTGGSNVPLDQKDLWRPIHSFFNRLLELDSQKRQKQFGAVMEVTHG